MKLLALTLVSLFAMNANATGGFSCSYDDRKTKLEIGGVTSHGFESGIVQASATVNGEVFGREHFIQYWNNDGEFRLALYKETETTTTIVRLKTKSVDDIEYRGTALIQQGGKTKTVKISCGLE